MQTYDSLHCKLVGITARHWVARFAYSGNQAAPVRSSGRNMAGFNHADSNPILDSGCGEQLFGRPSQSAPDNGNPRPSGQPDADSPARELPKFLNPRRVKALIDGRRLRRNCLQSDLFGDPCWDLVLELLLARVEGRPMPISCVGICCGVPPATAHRWLDRLRSDGLIIRRSDASDGRRVLVELSDGAVERIGRYLDAVGFSSFNWD